MKLYSLTKLSGDTVVVNGAVCKEGFVFAVSPEEPVDIPIYSIKCNNEFIKFCQEQLFDNPDIRDC